MLWNHLYFKLTNKTKTNVYKLCEIQKRKANVYYLSYFELNFEVPSEGISEISEKLSDDTMEKLFQNGTSSMTSLM